ncbi:hypothetical protein L21SP5_03165 [Salinivirga cyanobacteriivorans]|uniref:Uncharacterized protein n=1 Tax=Salinivirga cyanobacteriivorans TaxID=1307839 RepID=A0A0S2I465_9BACT|nr:hypothetical protein [Salinivirga cyanobacteriivorans]ALO16780.1 hypothetical protein L21SP5_03165 [Salinivirga cyanobacteriivorans]
MKKINVLIIVLVSVAATVSGQTEAITANQAAKGTALQLHFEAGEAHNHPSFAVWVEDLQGNFKQTLFVTKSVGTGIYPYKPAGDLKWEKGPGRAHRPAALPYWFHKRDEEKLQDANIPDPDNPVPDAYTGATPKQNFNLAVRTDEPLQGKVRVLLEVNQPWDVNEFWTNAKHPENTQYLTSCQPAVIYAVTIDLDKPMDMYYLNPIGHSHPYGADGKLYTNLTTLTTALDIFTKIKLKIE